MTTRSIPPRSGRRNDVIGPPAARSRNRRCTPIPRGAATRVVSQRSAPRLRRSWPTRYRASAAAREASQSAAHAWTASHAASRPSRRSPARVAPADRRPRGRSILEKTLGVFFGNASKRGHDDPIVWLCTVRRQLKTQNSKLKIPNSEFNSPHPAVPAVPFYAIAVASTPSVVGAETWALLCRPAVLPR